jgi:hypothetical protein
MKHIKNLKKMEHFLGDFEYVYDKKTKKYVLREFDWNDFVGWVVDKGKKVVDWVVKTANDLNAMNPNEIKNRMKRDFEDAIINPVKREFDKIKNDTEKGLIAANELMTKDILKVINDIKSVFSDLITQADKMMKQIKNLTTDSFNQVAIKAGEFAKKFLIIGTGLGKIFKGVLVDAPVGMGKGLKRGFDNMGVLFLWTGEFLLSYLTCGIHYIENLRNCIFYYSIDAVAKLFYFPITLFLWISWEVFESDLYEMHDKIWNTIYYIDKDFYEMFGFHFARYPDSIKNNCYNCKRLKVLALKNKSNQVNYDFNTNIPNLLNEAKTNINQGSNDFVNGFK